MWEVLPVDGRKDSLRVGVIGYRNHAARIRRILEEMSGVAVSRVFHPDRRPDVEQGTNRLEDLRECDAVFIVSPNATHASYLDTFADFPGYIFCEKPPVTSRRELAAIRNDPARTWFNFNMRQGLFARVARESLEAGALGRVLFADATTCHGLAFKPGYPESWRADASSHRGGILETVAIHYLDLFKHLFGDVRSASALARNVAGTGSAPDTVRCALSFAEGCMSTITASYAAPFHNTARIVGTEAVLEKIGDRVMLRGPRDTFDESGRFVDPPVLETFETPEGGLHADSLRRSVAWFVQRAMTGQALDGRSFRESLGTMELLFGLEDGLPT